MERKYFDVIVVGGGASGIMASISAAKTNVSVAIIEHLNKVGKKILVTGNGRCNYTNLEQGVSHYYGENPAFVVQVIEQFGVQQTIDYFKSIGIYPKNRNQYLYPQSDQATSVRDLLLAELNHMGVSIYCDTKITQINWQNNTFMIQTDNHKFVCKSLIIASGLYAGQSCGCDGSMIPYIEKFGHHFTDIVPGLVQLKTNLSFFKRLAGIRAEINLKMYINGELKGTESGELQLTSQGISGIVVFQLSRLATKALKKNQEVEAIIDFKPDISLSGLEQQIHTLKSNNGEKSFSLCLEGLFSRKLIPELLRLSKIPQDIILKQISNQMIEDFCTLAKDFCVPITGSNTFAECQVCAGGIITQELDSLTLMSKMVPNLFFAGEVIDIDGKCGGYNLQWAWSSGYVAGKYGGIACDQNFKFEA